MLRPTRPEDAEAACALVQAGIETYARFAAPGWTAPDLTTAEIVSDTAVSLARPDAFGRVEITRAGELEGVVLWIVPDPDRASPDGWLPDVHLRWLFVAETRWGDGLARRLHALAVAAMQERGVRTARLATPEGHGRARRFYEREGWRLRLGPTYNEHMGLDLLEYRLDVGSAAT